MTIGITFIVLGLLNLLLTLKNAKRKGQKMMVGSISVTVIIILIGVFLVLNPDF